VTSSQEHRADRPRGQRSGEAPDSWNRDAELAVKSIEAEALRAELAEALRRNEEMRRERRVLDREIVELRSMLAESERQLGSIRQTFIYRIGDAIVSARTWKGLRNLPRRLLALRRAYVEKRRAARADGSQERVSERLRYVEDALKTLEAGGLDEAVAGIRSMPDRNAPERARALVELAHAVRLDQPEKAAELAVEAGAINPKETASRLRALVIGLFDQGEVGAPTAILDGLAEQLMVNEIDRPRREIILAHSRQIAAPMVLPPRAVRLASDAPRLAVVSPRSLPQHAEALTFRAQAIVEAALSAGREAVLVTSPGYQYPKSGDGEPAPRRIGPIDVVRLPPTEAPLDAFDVFAPEAGAVMAALFLRRRITHVHALAGTTLAAAAAWAARRIGAKLTLDIGALPTYCDRIEEGWEKTERYRAGHSLFAELIASADEVIVRSRAIADCLTVQGLLGNALVIDDATPAAMARVSSASIVEIRQELGLADRRVIGVFESLDGDEGLADIVRALPAIREAVPSAAILFCGSGRGALSLTHLAARLGIADHVMAPANFVRQRTADYLSAFSVAVFPKRRPSLLGLAAPFELQATMAVGAPVVAADVPWARDWVRDGVTGLTARPGDSQDLASKVIAVLSEPDLASRLAAAGAELVHERADRRVINPRIVALMDAASERAAA
jgi:glycosyltransferase involved in cell wall biosynthesis